MWPTHCVQNSHGAEFHEDLKVEDTDIIIRKGQNDRVDSYSGFGTHPEDTGLNQQLKDAGITTVYVVGLAYDYCVGMTAEDAAKNGYETYLIMDATRSIAPDTTEKMDKSLEGLGAKKIMSKDI